MMTEHIFHPEILLDKKGAAAERDYARKLLGAMFFDTKENSYRMKVDALPSDAKNRLMREGDFRRSDFLITVQNLKTFADGDKKIFCLNDELCDGLAGFGAQIKVDALPGNSTVFLALPSEKFITTSGDSVNGLYVSFREAVDGDEKMLSVDDLDFVLQLTIALNKSTGGIALSSWEIPIAANQTLYQTVKPWHMHAKKILSNILMYDVVKEVPNLSRADAMEVTIKKAAELFMMVNTMVYVGLYGYLFIFSEEVDFSGLRSKARREHQAQPPNVSHSWDEITKSASVEVTCVDLNFRAHELKGPSGGTA